MFENSDDYDFAPSGSSKLSSLFDGFTLPSDAKSTLTYSAPKQPKIKKDVDSNESIKSKTQTSVVLAKVIVLWKLEDKDYKSLGKHGLALIGSADLNLFEVISYKEKNNIILRRKVNSTFSFYNQKDNFSSFYDNENQNWLVKFENIDDQNTFCKEIKNRGASIVNNIEPSLPTNKESASKPDVLPRENITPKPEAMPRLSQTFEKDTEDVNSDSSGSQKRASILSRMAKMGQQILPKDIIKNTSTDISDSELDDTKNEKVPPRRVKRTVQHIPQEEKPPQYVQQKYMENPVLPMQNSNINYPVQYPQQNMMGAFPQSMGATFPTNMLSPVLVNQAIPYDGFHQYVLSQNTELKMNLAQISAKLDCVLNTGIKSDVKTDDGGLKSKIKTLELRSENLLSELEGYEQKYEDLQKKCKYLEEKSSESEDNKSVIQNLNRQVDNLKKDIQIAEKKVYDYGQLEAELEKCKNDIQDYKKYAEIQTLKLQDFEQFYEENKNNTNLQETIDTLNDTVTNLKLKLKDFEEHFLKKEEEKQKRIEEYDKTINMFSDKIKDHMNNMYQSILTSFEENGSYSVSQIKSQVAQNLKGTTFAIINEFRDIYKTDADISNQ